jgi:hypothetical protein
MTEQKDRQYSVRLSANAHAALIALARKLSHARGAGALPLNQVASEILVAEARRQEVAVERPSE